MFDIIYLQFLQVPEISECKIRKWWYVIHTEIPVNKERMTNMHNSLGESKYKMYYK